MRALWAIVRTRFQLLLQYRAAALAGLVTQVFFGAVIIAVMKAYYASAQGALPLNYSQIVTYVWLGQAFFSLLPWRADGEIKALVTSGGLAYELLRPLDLYNGWFARAMALRTAPVFLRAVPLLVAAMIFMGLKPPVSVEAGVFWTLAMVGAVALSAAITVLLNLSLLWTLSADGCQYLVMALVTMLSGQWVPLPFYPDWLQPVIAALPFRGLLDTPDRIWLGELAGREMALALLHQWLWVGVLVAGGRYVLARGLRRVVIQGG